MAKILVFAGSARRDSFNKKLAVNAYNLIKEKGAEATLIDLKDYPMPIYNGDDEQEHGLPDNAKKLKKLFIEHSGMFIASPEYNSSISPLLKNSLDWISRVEDKNEPSLIAFNSKIIALGAASPGGFGGLRGLVPLRMMLGNIGVIVTPSQICIPSANNTFDSEGKIIDSNYKSTLEKVVQQLIEMTKKFVG